MSTLTLNQLMEKELIDNKKKYKSVVTDDLGKHYSKISYSTPLPLFDFLNGTVKKNTVRLGNEEIDYVYECVGIRSGSVIQFAGTSQTGKSTLARMISAYICDKFPMSNILDFNAEGGMDDQWFRTISGWDQDKIDARYTLYDYVTTSTLYDSFMAHVSAKINGIKNYPDDYMYDTGLMDYNGNSINHPIPSFVILDSWKSITLPKYEERQGENFRNNMDSANAAKVKGGMLEDFIKYCRKYNIIIFIINSSQEQISTGMFDVKKSQFMYSDNGVYIPGGKLLEHYSDEIFMLENKGKFNPKQELKIDNGHYISLKVFKTRASKNAGKSILLAFVSGSGFNHVLTMYKHLLTHELIGPGTATKKSLYGFENMKFFQREFIEKYETDPVFRDAFKIVGITSLYIAMGTCDVNRAKCMIESKIK